jgi:hypothetical protein
MGLGKWTNTEGAHLAQKEKGPRNEPLTLDIVFFIKWSATTLT